MKTTFNILSMLIITATSMLCVSCKKNTPASPSVTSNTNPVTGTADPKLLGNWLLKKREVYGNSIHVNTDVYTNNTCHYSFSSSVSTTNSGYYLSITALACVDLDGIWRVIAPDTLDIGLNVKYKILLVNTDSLVIQDLSGLPTTSQVYHLSRL